MSAKRIAIVGLGCAGCHALQAIRETDGGAEIDVYSETELPPYNPMLTTYYASGRLPYSGLFPFGTLEEIRERYGAKIFTGDRVVKVAAGDRRVETASGRQKEYDQILIAAGATAFVPPSFGGLKDVFCMRTVEDAEKLRRAVEELDPKNAVIVGASMVGIKVAELLHNRGCHVTLADMAPHIFALAAYPEVSEMIEGRLEAMGVELALGQAITRAEEDTDSRGKPRYTVSLADGRTLETELLVLNIGTRAACSFVDRAEIAVDRGILVDGRMRTSAPGIYAAGDCCQGDNLQSGGKQIIGLWANAGVQGRIAGRNMAGVTDETDGNILHNITHFLDMDFIGLGDNRLTGEVRTYRAPEGGFYLQAVYRDGRPVGFNILDNYGVSGIIKAQLIKVLRGQPCRFSPEQRGQLVRYGVPERMIDTLEAGI